MSAHMDENEPLDRMTRAEQRQTRAAFDRDVWAGEWNSLPTAIDRLLAARIDAVEAALAEAESGCEHPASESCQGCHGVRSTARRVRQACRTLPGTAADQ